MSLLAVKPRAHILTPLFVCVTVLLIALNRAALAENATLAIYDKSAARFLVSIQANDDGGRFILDEVAVIRTETGDFEVWDHKEPVRLTSTKRPKTELLGKVTANQISEWFKKWELIETACRAEITQREFQDQAGISAMTNDELRHWLNAHPEQKLEHGTVTTIHVTFIAQTGERHEWRDDLGAKLKGAWALVQAVRKMVTSP